MNPNDIAPMVVMTTFIVVGGGVLLLRPLAKRLGGLIDVMIAERRRASVPDDRDRLAAVLENLEQRLRLLEERQDFTDSLLSVERGSRPGETTAKSLGRPRAESPTG
jgi:hypothetical protein